MRRLLGAVLAALVALGVFAPQAGAAAGCPWLHIPPSGFTCIDSDQHHTSGSLGRFQVTTDWYTRNSDGERAVAMAGKISVDGFGEHTVTVELRNAGGTVLGSSTFTLRRTDIWQPWWKDVSLPLHVGDEIASVRYTLRSASTGNAAPVKISRPTD